MDDLVQWLRVQLDEDERIARTAPRGPWAVTDAGSIVDADSGRVVSSVGGALDGRVSCWPEGPVVDHVLAHDPARVLREIDAKRQLINWVRKWPLRTHTPASVDGVLELLALPYADRPGYREEWRP
jgi:hypothetical protein